MNTFLRERSVLHGENCTSGVRKRIIDEDLEEISVVRVQQKHMRFQIDCGTSATILATSDSPMQESASIC